MENANTIALSHFMVLLKIQSPNVQHATALALNAISQVILAQDVSVGSYCIRQNAIQRLHAYPDFLFQLKMYAQLVSFHVLHALQLQLHAPAVLKDLYISQNV